MAVVLQKQELDIVLETRFAPQLTCKNIILLNFTEHHHKNYKHMDKLKYKIKRWVLTFS